MYRNKRSIFRYIDIISAISTEEYSVTGVVVTLPWVYLTVNLLDVLLFSAHSFGRPLLSVAEHRQSGTGLKSVQVLDVFLVNPARFVPNDDYRQFCVTASTSEGELSCNVPVEIPGGLCSL